MPSSVWTTSSGSASASAASTDLATGASVVALNSVDYLTNLDKIRLINDWNAELQIQTQLDAQATALGVSSVPYDNAVAALSSGLIAAGAPSNWATAWPDGTTWNHTGIMTSLQGWWTTIANQRATLQATLTATVNNAAAYANVLARSSYNLIKNGNSEMANPSGFEAANLLSGYAYSGAYSRIIACPASGFAYGWFTDFIPCGEGEQFYFQAMGAANLGSAGAYSQIGLIFYDASKTQITSADVYSSARAATNWVGLAGSYGEQTVSGAAPVGAAYVRPVCLGYGGSVANTWVGFDNLYACRKISAGMLEADLAILGVIRSPNYVAGAYGSAPVGFKLSGYAFTTTFIDGTTDATCFFELQQTANFGGYKVSTVNNRIFTAYNRILNGGFYSNLNGWSQNNANTAWNSATDVSGLGSVAVNVTTGTVPKAGSIIQPFSCPPTTATVNLTLKTAVSAPASVTSSGTYVKAYITNMSTGVETLLATWNYSTAPTSPSFTSRSVDVTSYVSAGGDFALRIELSIQTPISGDSCLIYARDIKIPI